MYVSEDGKDSSNSQVWGLPYSIHLESCNAKHMLLVNSKVCKNVSIYRRVWTNIIRENIEVELPEGVFISKLQFLLSYLTT